MDDFGKYKLLKSQFDLIYKGISLNRVLAMDIWYIVNKQYKFSWKHYFLFLFALDVRKINFDSTTQKVLSTFGRYGGRKDHFELYNAVIKKIGNSVSFNNTLEWPTLFAFHPILVIRLFFQGYKKLKPSSLTMKERCQLIIMALHYCNTLIELDKMSFVGVQKYLCQCSVLGLENLLTQFFKLRNIPTYSLQEGIYFVFKKNPPLDSIQYENFETDNLLCWGQFSVDEDASYGIPTQRLRVAGYPKKVKLYPMKEVNPYKKCMVLLARDSFRDTNSQLLNILLKYSDDYDFCIKLHPSCDFEFYSSFASQHGMTIIPKDKTINDCLDNKLFDFAIAVNTTAYYEALMRGLPCLRFCDDTFDLMAGCKDVFGKDEMFCEIMETLRMQPLSAYQEEVNHVLKYAIGIGIDNYKKIICE